MTTGFGDSEATVVMWRCLFTTGLERCVLVDYENGAHGLEGTVLMSRDGEALEIDYTINLDRNWRTIDAEVVIVGDEGEVFNFEVDKHGRWTIETESGDDPKLLPEAELPIDLDLGFTPATNLLPIRRLDLGIGDSEEITTVWLKYPDMRVQIAHQRYTRLGSDRYRYESPGFSAEITVDENGLPVEYAGLWERATDSWSVVRSP